MSCAFLWFLAHLFLLRLLWQHPNACSISREGGVKKSEQFRNILVLFRISRRLFGFNGAKTGICISYRSGDILVLRTGKSEKFRICLPTLHRFSRSIGQIKKLEASPVAGFLMFYPSLTPHPPTHTHPPLKTRLLELADRGTTVEFVKKGGGREKTSIAVLSTEWAISLSLSVFNS